MLNGCSNSPKILSSPKLLDGLTQQKKLHKIFCRFNEFDFVDLMNLYIR